MAENDKLDGLDKLGGDDAPAAPAPAAAPAPSKNGHGGARTGAGRPPGKSSARPAADPAAAERAAKEALQAEREKRLDVARARLDSNKESIVVMLVQGYALPFRLWARASGVPEIALDDATLVQRGATLYWALRKYCPDVERYAPLIALGLAVTFDVTRGVELMGEAKKRAQRPFAAPAPAAVADVVQAAAAAANAPTEAAPAAGEKRPHKKKPDAPPADK